MKGSVEILSGILRGDEVIDEGGARYKHVVTFSSVDGKTAVLKGFVKGDKQSTFKLYRLATQLLKPLGLTPVFVRRNHGTKARKVRPSKRRKASRK